MKDNGYMDLNPVLIRIFVLLLETRICPKLNTLQDFSKTFGRAFTLHPFICKTFGNIILEFSFVYILIISFPGLHIKGQGHFGAQFPGEGGGDTQSAIATLGSGIKYR